MKIIDRLYQIAEYKGVTIAQFERENSLSVGYMRSMKNRKADIGESVLMKIINNYADLSVEWIVTGEGEMLKTEPLEQSDKTALGNIALQQIKAQDLGVLLLHRLEELAIENARLKDRVSELESSQSE